MNRPFDGIRFDLCRQTGLVLRYQPADTDIPFRGRAAQSWCIISPRP